MTAVLPVIPDARSVGVEQAAALARQIEAWADTTDDVAALEDARAKVAAIETYLRRKHEDASTEIARADRRLEIRIGEILGPPPGRGGDRRSDGIKAPRGFDPSPLPPQRASQFRKMAAAASEPEVAEAVERGASRAEVLREAERVVERERARAAEEAEDRKWRDDNVAKPTDPEGDRFRARVWDSILAVEQAAKSMSKWTADDVRRAIQTEKAAHVRQQMTDGLVDSLATLAKYTEVTG